MQKVRVANNTPEPANSWFEKRRDFHIRSLYRDFRVAYAHFVSLYQGSVSADSIHFTDLSRLVGTATQKGHLWQLKDHCHRLFKGSGQHHDLLLDQTVSALFHEAMKLKENISMLQSFGSTGPEQGQDNALNASPRGAISYHYFSKGVSKEAGRQVENLAMLFNHTNFLLRMHLFSQANNVLLLRLLLEESALSQELWSESVAEIFADLFPYQPEVGYLLSAKSYFNGQWLAEALAAYAAALALNPDLEEARRRTFLLRTMIRDRQKIMAA